MSLTTYATITRGAATLSASSSMQIDSKNPLMAAYYDKNHPYWVYDVYVPGGAYLEIAAGDLFTDQFNTDPLTGSAKQYRVVGDPKPFPDGHVECVATRFAGPS